MKNLVTKAFAAGILLVPAVGCSSAGGAEEDPFGGALGKSKKEAKTVVEFGSDLDPRAEFSFNEIPGDIYEVRQGGGGDYESIQDCADQVRAGDACVVFNGIYDERITFNPDGSNSGEDGRKVYFISQPRRAATVLQGFDTRYADHLRIQGFRLKREVSRDETIWNNMMTIKVDSDFVEIVDNYFSGLGTRAVEGQGGLEAQGVAGAEPRRA